jgi:uncharacterized phage infection (PIP) family protein YhgE
MSSFFVVGAQKNLRELVPSLIQARTPAGTRDAALAAIVRANPSLDFDHLRPGAVVLVPPVDGIKRSLDSPTRTAADDLLQRVRDGMQALAQAAQQAEETRTEEKKEAQDLFDTALVKRIASQVAELSANIESVRETFKEDDATSHRAQADLRKSLDAWKADLEGLRHLL